MSTQYSKKQGAAAPTVALIWPQQIRKGKQERKIIHLYPYSSLVPPCSSLFDHSCLCSPKPRHRGYSHSTERPAPPHAPSPSMGSPGAAWPRTPRGLATSASPSPRPACSTASGTLWRPAAAARPASSTAATNP
jgi:hypothetical protein